MIFGFYVLSSDNSMSFVESKILFESLLLTNIFNMMNSMSKSINVTLICVLFLFCGIVFSYWSGCNLIIYTGLKPVSLERYWVSRLIE